MSKSTRRGFLKIAGTGVAAAGAAAVVPAVIGHDSRAAKEAEVALPDGARGSLMAHVDDLHKGEVTVMVEGREVTVTDHQLVARLAHALHTARTHTSAPQA